MTRDEPQRIEIEVELSAPGLLVLGDLYDADWQAFYRATADATPRQVPVLRTHRVLRGVWLPSGSGRLVFVYRPRMFYVGAAISAAGWVVWLAMLAARRLKTTP